tara:strand:- start:2303 stop:2944 length:642 start_codon:yes stop_codon:yes gene_type:complete
MKIALISMPRVGSNYLFDNLKKHYGYDYKHEPYTNPANGWDFDPFSVDDNFLYKGLVYHHPIGWWKRKFWNNNPKTKHYGTDEINGKLVWNKLNWYDIDKDVNELVHKINHHYDKVIYLDGEDMDRIVHSYTIAYITGEWYKKTDYSVKYSEEKYAISEEEDKKHWKEFLKYYQNVLKAFSSEENYFTYEGLIKTDNQREKLNNYLSEEIKWK